LTGQGILRHCCNYDYYICTHLEKVHDGDTLAQCPVISGILREQPNRATLGLFSSLSAGERSSLFGSNETSEHSEAAPASDESLL
jgi:hypothetical protein